MLPTLTRFESELLDTIRERELTSAFRIAWIGDDQSHTAQSLKELGLIEGCKMLRETAWRTTELYRQLLATD